MKTMTVDVMKFISAGRAVFTLTSKKTGQSFTYRVARPASDPERGPLFASVLTGPDNTADYTYMGIVNLDSAGVPMGWVQVTRNSKVGSDAPSFKALHWFLQRGGQSPMVEFRHEGRCGRCARVLTVPSSIDSGFGPECAGRV
jgi:hypothetical protein